MNGLDSISNPVGISYTGSYPLACSSAQTYLGSSRLGSTQLGSRLMAWLVGPTVMTCQLIGRWHGWWAPLWWRVNWLVAGMACQLCMLTTQLCHANVTLIWVSHMGRVIWYSGLGQPIRAKKMRGEHLRAWAGTSLVRVGEYGHVPRQNFALFSPLCSSLPPLHSGMVRTPFWQLWFLSKDQTPH
jgi:hypothetical protein